MILADPTEIAHYARDGLWGRVTLDGLLSRNAASRPLDLALDDVSARAQADSGQSGLTWGELDARVSRLAVFFVELGLRPDASIGIQLGNRAEAIIAHLAALRAGLIPLALPCLWQRAALTEAAQRLAPVALITSSTIGPARQADTMREVAADSVSVRFVLGFGEAVPDGVHSLDEVMAMPLTTEGAAVEREDNPADHVAMVTFDTATRAPAPVARSHNQWLAAATACVGAARLGHHAALATTMMPTTLAGLATGLASWLLAGCRLVLVMPDHIDAIDSKEVTHLVLPGPAAMHLKSQGHAPPVKTLRVWRGGAALIATPDPEAIDILSLGELAIWSGKRGLTIPLAGEDVDEPLAELLKARMQGLSQKAADCDQPGAMLRGTLSVAGPQLPGRPFPGGDDQADGEESADPDGFRPTGLRCSLTGTSPAVVRIIGYAGEVFARGGIAVAAEAVDALYADCPGVADAAVVPVPDPLLGTRFHAAVVEQREGACTLEAFRAHLAEQGAAPYLLPDAVIKVDSIPRGQNGRTLRGVLETQAAA